MSGGPRTLVVGDVHGCASELSDLIERASATRVVLVGDLFTKGPDPLGVWELIEAHAAEAVLGNHDVVVLKAREGRPWSVLPREAFRWLKRRPLVLGEDGWTVVHAGLHPTAGVLGTTRKMALNMRRWPMGGRGEGSSRSFWWERYDGPGLVVYGHDARRGLVDRRPVTLGLDTGCVYGGALTGYLVEADELVQVSARRVYRPV